MFFQINNIFVIPFYLFPSYIYAFIFILFIQFFPYFRGACPCSVNKTCVDPNQSCNCDVKENKWYSDEGYYREPHSLGITHMYFLQQKDLDEEAQGRITLGPLECVETSKLATADI